MTSKSPFIFRFLDQPLCNRQLRQDEFPEWSSFPLQYARKHLIEFKNTSILLQSFSCEFFHIDLFHLNTTVPFTLPYETRSNQIFLFLMLKGTIAFSTQDGTSISRLEANNINLMHKDIGLYNAVFPTNSHIALFVALSSEWLATLDTSACPVLGSAITNFRDKQKPYGVMPPCQLCNRVHKWLKELYLQHHRVIWVQTSEMKVIVCRMLIRYEELSWEKQQQIAYRAKAYIEENFNDPALKIPKIAIHLSSTEKTLNKQFKKTFGVSLYQYLKCYRMNQAQELLTLGKAQLSEVHLMVGCNDRDNFSKQFKKTFGYPPSKSVKNKPILA